MNPAAQSYCANGIALVPLAAGGKSPGHADWNERDRSITDPAIAATLAGNIGIAHAYSSPRSAALDVDDLDRATAWLAKQGIDLPALIDASDSVSIQSGRPNRIKLLFRLPDDAPAFPTKVVKVDGKTILEFRCATADGKTVQDVLPPSIHPITHQPYQWGGNGHWTSLPVLPRAVVTLWESLLVPKSQPSSGTANLGPRPAYANTQPGRLAIAIAGNTLPETPENIALVDQWLASVSADCPRADWLNVLMAGHALDWTSGKDVFRRWSMSAPHRFKDADFERVWHSLKPGRGITWRSLRHYADHATNTTGGSADAVDTTDVAPADLLVPSWLEELNQRYAEVRVGSTVLILDQQTAVETPTGLRYTSGYIDVSAFRQTLNGRYCDQPGPRAKAPSLANAFLSHPCRRKYEGAIFDPAATTPATILNLWTGFAVDPVPGDLSLWLRVLDAVVPDPTTRHYVLHWLAWKVQRPGQIPGTILLVLGGKGSGKNSLFDPVVRIFGNHGRVFDDAEQIAGRFTGHLQTVAFAVLDEALFTGNSQQADRIKSRVTATTTTFEAKGRDPIPGLNRCAYVSLSNHTHVWQATVDERRAVVVEASATLVNQRAFWTQYYAWLNGPGPAALLDYLQALDLGTFDPRAIPKGEALRRQIEQTALRDPATAWWHTVLSNGAINLRQGLRIPISDTDPTEINKADLHESFRDATARSHGGDWPTTMRKLKVWTGPGGLTEHRPRQGVVRLRTVTLAPLPQLRQAFEVATGIRFDDDHADA